jgi:hypothetical protein
MRKANGGFVLADAHAPVNQPAADPDKRKEAGHYSGLLRTDAPKTL